MEPKRTSQEAAGGRTPAWGGRLTGGSAYGRERPPLSANRDRIPDGAGHDRTLQRQSPRRAERDGDFEVGLDPVGLVRPEP